MPSRTIRDTVLDSERYHACPVESRLLFLELLLCADDYALVPIGEVFLRRHTTACEGKTTAQIAGFLTPLMEHDLIRPYTSERGGRFAFIPRFDNRPRALKPKWPLPPQGLDDGYVQRMIPTSEVFRNKKLRESCSTSGVQMGGETETEVLIPTNATVISKSTPTKRMRAKPAFCLPDWIPAKTWADFEEMRRKIRRPLTDAAKVVNVRKIDELRGKGYDPVAVLEEAIANSWTGIWEPKLSAAKSSRHSATGQHMATVARDWLNENKEDE